MNANIARKKKEGRRIVPHFEDFREKYMNKGATNIGKIASIFYLKIFKDTNCVKKDQL